MTTITQYVSETATVAQLVRAAQAGDRNAFGQLIERYQSMVFAIALRRLRNYAEAQELSQDVFVQALQKIDQLQNPVCFGGWLRSITHRMAINRAIRRAPDIAFDPSTLDGSCADTRTPLSNVLDNERKLQVRAGLERLRAMDRDTLVAFYVQGRSLLEMSDDFDAPVGTIKRRLHVARKRLAKEVEELVAV